MGKHIFLHSDNAEEHLEDVIGFIKEKVYFDSRQKAWKESADYWKEYQQKELERIKTAIDDILYTKYEECGTPEQVNENGFTKGHYLIEEITAEIEKLFTNSK